MSPPAPVMRPSRLPKGHRMVRWLGPRGLLSTGLDVLVSGIFSKYADKRELQGALRPQRDISFDGDSSIWIDYIADVGDGWHSTYTMAWLLTQGLRVETPDGSEEMDRGRILVMGGDQVYPRASEDHYDSRLLCPYQAATAGRKSDGSHTLLAIPGNHDWYDGLTSFLRRFCRESSFAEWRTPQTRSYFAVQLPHKWWLLGIDAAFDSYIDHAQLEFFRGRICRRAWHFRHLCGHKVHARDRIILCVAKPAWENASLRGDYRSKRQRLGRRALYAFEQEISNPAEWNCELRLVLSGDLHHYARYAPMDSSGPQRITAGGGGAFFYPTHAAASPVLWPSDGDPNQQESLDLQKTFPDRKTSRLWRWPVLFAPLFANPTFAAFAGVLYLLLALVLPGSITEPDTNLKAMFQPPTARPPFVVLVTLLYLGLVVFADARRPGKYLVLGPLHTLAHVGGLIATVRLAHAIVVPVFASQGWPHGRTSLALVAAVAPLIILIGGVLAGLVMGAYLMIAQLARRHPNEAFAAMHLTRYKNFLRIHIDEAGRLTVFPIGVRRVCKNWEVDPTAGKPFYRPVECPTYELIEGPLKIPPDPR